MTATLRQFAPTRYLQLPAMFASHAMEQLQRDATGASRERMLRELGEAIAAMTAETPIILVLEDLHWADPASVNMLRHLAERTRTQRLLVVGTARPEDVERSKSARPKKGRIPDELWAAAVEVARRDGVNRTAQALHLDSGKLMRRLVAADKGRHEPAPTAFLELVSSPPEIRIECVVEAEGRIPAPCESS